MKRVFALLFGLVSLIGSVSASAETLNNQKRVDFTTGFQGLSTNLSVMTTSVMPGKTIRFSSPAVLSAETGRVARDEQTQVWTAPNRPGRHALHFDREGQRQTIHVFVLTPFKNGEQQSLNGYKIGEYRKTLFRGMSTYEAPTGMIDLSHGPADFKISPSFTLGQFICKQQPGHDPTYLLILPETLIKLEALLEEVRRQGWDADSFHVMSGFRTPFYNRAIGNRTTSSRHLYGGAADIWVDTNGDGRMDDLNRDGVVNKKDAQTLAAWAEKLARERGENWVPGGIGVYAANSVRGPFVHIDSRGYQARW